MKHVNDIWMNVIWPGVPTVILTAALFYLLRVVLHMDRNERKAYAKIEQQERAKRGLPPASHAADR